MSYKNFSMSYCCAIFTLAAIWLFAPRYLLSISGQDFVAETDVILRRLWSAGLFLLGLATVFSTIKGNAMIKSYACLANIIATSSFLLFEINKCLSGFVYKFDYVAIAFDALTIFGFSIYFVGFVKQLQKASGAPH